MLQINYIYTKIIHFDCHTKKQVQQPLTSCFHKSKWLFVIFFTIIEGQITYYDEYQEIPSNTQ